MADILDYLDWRGDIPFSTDPFNEVDNLVLSELAYVDFAGIVPGPEDLSDPERINREPEKSVRDPERTFREQEKSARDPERTCRELQKSARDPERTSQDSQMNPREEGAQERQSTPSLQGAPDRQNLQAQGIDISTAAKRYWELHSVEEIERSNTLFRRAPLLLEKLCRGARFGHMRLTAYVNQVSPEKNEQMSGLVCLLDDGTAYAAFRGTDDTIVGWKEDFTFSFRRETSGQKSAAQYLSRCFGQKKGGLLLPVRVGGHSKGGNFAVYASAFCDADVRRRILDIYTNDGPGFLEDVTDTPAYREILPRVHSIIPEESVFGLLLECGYYHKVVKSSKRGIWQHDALSWQVLRNRFIEAPCLSERSTLLEKAVESWIRSMPLEERKEFVDTLFSLFADTGIETVSEITADQFRTIPELLHAYRDMEREDRRLLRETVGRLFKSGADSLNEELQARIRKLTDKSDKTEDLPQKYVNKKY